MSELKKIQDGDLVFSVNELGWVDYIMGMPERYEHLQVTTLSGKTHSYSGGDRPPKATREQVEAYLKEKGWELWYDGYTKKGVSPYHIQSMHQWAEGGTEQIYRWGVAGTVREKDFDTAPAQHAEAILMAKLLNATKD